MLTHTIFTRFYLFRFLSNGVLKKNYKLRQTQNRYNASFIEHAKMYASEEHKSDYRNIGSIQKIQVMRSTFIMRCSKINTYFFYFFVSKNFYFCFSLCRTQTSKKKIFLFSVQFPAFSFNCMDE